jgi:hypothetical protein
MRSISFTVLASAALCVRLRCLRVLRVSRCVCSGCLRTPSCKPPGFSRPAEPQRPARAQFPGPRNVCMERANVLDLVARRWHEVAMRGEPPNCGHWRRNLAAVEDPDADRLLVFGARPAAPQAAGSMLGGLGSSQGRARGLFGCVVAPYRVRLKYRLHAMSVIPSSARCTWKVTPAGMNRHMLQPRQELEC